MIKTSVKKLLSNAKVPIKSKMSIEEAYLLLNTYSPRPNGTCYTTNRIENTYDLQIIIPVYNAEKYIKDCLDSVCSQHSKYKTLVTVVNDGSTDETEHILTGITSGDGGGSELCIRVINQDNKGYSGARNTALSNIEAKYVMFLDSDDILPEGTISNMLDKAFITDADILQGSWYSFDDKSVRETTLDEKVFEVGTNGYVSGYPWGKLYKSSVLKNFQFPDGYWFEDTPITFILAAMPIKVVTIKDIIYGYRLNPNGITAKAIFYKKSVDTFWVTELCLNELPRFKVAYDQQAYEYLLRQSLMNATRIKNQGRKIREAVFVLTSELMRVHFRGFSSENPKMKKIEKALRDKQFIQFELSKLYL